MDAGSSASQAAEDREWLVGEGHALRPTRPTLDGRENTRARGVRPWTVRLISPFVFELVHGPLRPGWYAEKIGTLLLEAL